MQLPLSPTTSVVKPQKIIKSDIVNLFVAWELDKQSGVLLCGQHVSQMSIPNVLAAWVRVMVLSLFNSSGLRTSVTVRRPLLLQLPLCKLLSSRTGSSRTHNCGPHLYSICASMRMSSTLFHTSPRPGSAQFSFRVLVCANRPHLVWCAPSTSVFVFTFHVWSNIDVVALVNQPLHDSV